MNCRGAFTVFTAMVQSADASPYGILCAMLPPDYPTVVRIQNLNNSNAPYNYYDKSIEDEYKLYGGELLFAWSGTPGTSFGAHIWKGKEAVLNQHIFKLVFVESLLYKFYFMYALNQRVLTLIGQAHGSAGLQHITKGVFENTLIPIPPLSEQHRIVTKIEELLPFIEKYAQAETQLTTLNTSFPEALKKSILQEAVQGRLVPQDPNDEPASVLLERIRAEKQALIKAGKIKKDKHESFIVTRDKIPYEIIDGKERCIADEVPFEIPEGWEWCRLGSILLKLTDGTHSTPKYTESGVPFISVKDISTGKLDFSNCKYISEVEHLELYERCNPEFGDILLTKVGTTGIPVIVDTHEQFSLFVSVALLKFNNAELYNKYLLYMINSPLVQTQAAENTKGVGNKNWVMRDIANTLIVIPPLAEQHRIVAKIEELMKSCELL